MSWHAKVCGRGVHTVSPDPQRQDRQDRHPHGHRRRALFIAYTFPPVGGAGVQRTTKFVKYLPQFGWDATVLTAGNPSVPVRDESLCRDIPPSTHVVRARTFEPPYAAKRSLTQDAAQDAAAVSPIKRLMKAAARRAALALLQPDPQILWVLPAFRAASCVRLRFAA